MSYTPTNWVTGDTVTATKLNKIEQGIAEAAGGKYDVYDFVISRVDNGTPVIEKGVWSDIYDLLQAKEHVAGLYCQNSTPSEFHDTISFFIPLTFCHYYSSADSICGRALYDDGSGARRLTVEWNSDGTIEVTKVNA